MSSSAADLLWEVLTIQPSLIDPSTDLHRHWQRNGWKPNVNRECAWLSDTACTSTTVLAQDLCYSDPPNQVLTFLTHIRAVRTFRRSCSFIKLRMLRACLDVPQAMQPRRNSPLRSSCFDFSGGSLLMFVDFGCGFIHAFIN